MPRPRCSPLRMLNARRSAMSDEAIGLICGQERRR
jgi:hypothetical protein